jgi:hypothetical protein
MGLLKAPSKFRRDAQRPAETGSGAVAAGLISPYLSSLDCQNILPVKLKPGPGDFYAPKVTADVLFVNSLQIKGIFGGRGRGAGHPGSFGWAKC